jgi:hypothetical protein
VSQFKFDPQRDLNTASSAALFNTASYAGSESTPETEWLLEGLSLFGDLILSGIFLEKLSHTVTNLWVLVFFVSF